MSPPRKRPNARQDRGNKNNVGFFRLVERNAQGIFVKQKIFGGRCSYGCLFLLRWVFWGVGTNVRSVLSFFVGRKTFGTLARFLFGNTSFILETCF